jgi:16S rRNA (cytosine967-C5)-methyltransferase
VLRQRLLWQHLAQTGSGTLERRLAILAGRAAPTFLRGALGPHEQLWLEHVSAIDRATLPEKLRHNLPDWLAGALKEQVGNEGFWPLVGALDEPAPLDLRVNTLKAKREEVQKAELAEPASTPTPTPYSPWGLRVQGKPALNKLDVFTRGEVEVQDEGSQLLALLTDAKRGEMVVDFCAGAGGKTLALGAAMRNTGRLYAFDTSGHRLAALKPRWRAAGCPTSSGADRQRARRPHQAPGRQDRPRAGRCALFGSGHPAPQPRPEVAPVAGSRWPRLQAKQRAILASAARLLKPGGRLVYATCSLLAGRERDRGRGFTAERSDFVPLPAATALASGSRRESRNTLVAGRSPAPVAARHQHRRLLRGGLAAALTRPAGRQREEHPPLILVKGTPWLEAWGVFRGQQFLPPSPQVRCLQFGRFRKDVVNGSSDGRARRCAAVGCRMGWWISPGGRWWCSRWYSPTSRLHRSRSSCTVPRRTGAGPAPIPSHFFRFWLWLTTGMVTKEWVAVHRKHHAKCETKEDPHSPQHGLASRCC